MATPPGGIRVITYGQLVALQSLQHESGDVPMFTDRDLLDQVTFPVTINADTTYYVSGGWAVPLTLMAELHTGDALPAQTVQLTPGKHSLAAFPPDDTRSADVASRGPGLLVLNSGDPVPGGTPSGTVILRRP